LLKLASFRFYYSLVDWTHPAYRDDWETYVAYYQEQICELCTDFGRIDGFVFDGYWPRQEFEPGLEHEYFAPRGKWDLAGTYDLKSVAEIVEVYRKVREMGSVFFLNVGPRPFGDIHPEEQRVLREIGRLIREQ